MTRSRAARRLALSVLASAAVVSACTSAAITVDSPTSPGFTAPPDPTTSAPPSSPAPPATSTRSSSAAVSAVPADDGPGATRSAAELLQAIPVKGRAPMTGYSRDEFGSAWTDDNDDPLGHNGCDTRNDILRRDLADRVVKAGTYGCVVASGVLIDPYTGRRIDFVRGVGTSTAVQIDHVVALGDAWQTGAQRLTADARIDLANDPLELLAVDGPANEAKGDGDAATWLPPNKAYRCAYVARQIAVKARYGLWMTSAESAAAQRVLAVCPGQRAPGEAHLSVPLLAPPPTRSTTTRAPATRTTAATHSAPPAQGCTTTSSGNCIRGGEFCPQASYGQTGIDAEGRRYVCAGDSSRPHWELP